MDPVTAAGIGLGAIGVGGSLFGKKKKPSIDYAGMQRTVQSGSAKQRDLIGQQFDALQPLSEQYQSKADELGTGLEKRYADIASKFKGDLGNVGLEEQKGIDQILATRRTQSARDIPLQQQMIREQLAASGGLRTGAAGRALAAPTMQAQQQQGDLASQLAIEKQMRDAERMERGVTTDAEMAKEATSQKLGIDVNTMNTLLQTGRTDIIERLAALRGVEKEEVDAMLQIMGLKANTDIAAAAASNADRQALYNSLAGFGGQLIGMGGARSTAPAASSPSSSLFPGQRLVY